MALFPMDTIAYLRLLREGVNLHLGWQWGETVLKIERGVSSGKHFFLWIEKKNVFKVHVLYSF